MSASGPSWPPSASDAGHAAYKYPPPGTPSTAPEPPTGDSLAEPPTNKLTDLFKQELIKLTTPSEYKGGNPRDPQEYDLVKLKEKRNAGKRESKRVVDERKGAAKYICALAGRVLPPEKQQVVITLATELAKHGRRPAAEKRLWLQEGRATLMSEILPSLLPLDDTEAGNGHPGAANEAGA